MMNVLTLKWVSNVDKEFYKFGKVREMVCVCHIVGQIPLSRQIFNTERALG